MITPDNDNNRPTVALVGNPNCGKTTLFNALTGLRHKVGNYPGVTVERKEGMITLHDGRAATLIDLPGTYSLQPQSPDESITSQVLLHDGLDVALCVVDACNLERSLYLVSQVMDQEISVIAALTMTDVADEQGITILDQRLERELGIPVVRVIAREGLGIDGIKRLLGQQDQIATPHRSWALPEPVGEELQELTDLLSYHEKLARPLALHEGIRLLSAGTRFQDSSEQYGPEVLQHVNRDHQRLDALGIDRESVFIEARYHWVRQVCGRTLSQRSTRSTTPTDRIDKVVTHKVWGFVIFFGVMMLLFQTIFSWAEYPMNLINDLFNGASKALDGTLPPGDLRDLLSHGVVGGVAAVVSFLPQILALFFFIALLEDTGYMARAAFIMDKAMSKVGLNGRSFIPMLSSFACAIPGVMATRTIDNSRERLVTILVAPLVSCSARLPVYTLMIAAFIPNIAIGGIIGLPGLTLFLVYLLGLASALSMAWLLNKLLVRGSSSSFIMELPPYKTPSLKSIILLMWERSVLFLKNAGTMILGVSIILWFLSTYPRLEDANPSARLEYSIAGRVGHAIEPLIQPLGFDWRIGIGLIGSLLQREVFVSTMGTIYNMESGHDSASTSLLERLRAAVDPITGAPYFTLLTAICVMIYYVYAMQCMSTLAVVRRETNSWRWPAFQFVYMTAIAYAATFITRELGLWIGLGDL